MAAEVVGDTHVDFNASDIITSIIAGMSNIDSSPIDWNSKMGDLFNAMLKEKNLSYDLIRLSYIQKSYLDQNPDFNQTLTNSFSDLKNQLQDSLDYASNQVGEITSEIDNRKFWGAALDNLGKGAGVAGAGYTAYQLRDAALSGDDANFGMEVVKALTSTLIGLAGVAVLAAGSVSAIAVAGGVALITFGILTLIENILPPEIAAMIGDFTQNLLSDIEYGLNQLLDGTADLFDFGDIFEDVDFLDAQTWVPRRDPLTLDLDGDGLEVLPFGGPDGVLFDHDVDGVKTSTSSTVKAGAHQGLTAQCLTTPDGAGGWRGSATGHPYHRRCRYPGPGVDEDRSRK